MKGLERGFQLLRSEEVPVDVSEPGVGLYLSWSVEAQAVARFSLNQFIDEGCCFYGPTLRNVPRLYLYLFRQDLIPDLLSASPQVGPL